MKKMIFAAIMALMLAVTPALATPPENGNDNYTMTEKWNTTQNVFGSGAASISASGVAGWGNSGAFSMNIGHASASNCGSGCGPSAGSFNFSDGKSYGSAGFLSGGISGAGVFNFTIKDKGFYRQTIK